MTRQRSPQRQRNNGPAAALSGQRCARRTAGLKAKWPCKPPGTAGTLDENDVLKTGRCRQHRWRGKTDRTRHGERKADITTCLFAARNVTALRRPAVFCGVAQRRRMCVRMKEVSAVGLAKSGVRVMQAQRPHELQRQSHQPQQRKTRTFKALHQRSSSPIKRIL